ncbi:hypothetical protein CLTEP_12650 [Clostridium tepidiprofundi DSM 19306]|uniref:Translational regulator CsrA n=1 Tax=Clostridium tepidiprofundi DSM 19306 TaxID=1121338 RepID=A0A151B4S6_9CLOT|nr:carbon storage regulator CsrA [Clostridium tepidiprofundi]KYH34800.1 hypothetical protein CLTEP_12650 [Clostridium tepidiprofundi DSM 19306]
MLVIKRKKGEAIKIGDNVEITIVKIEEGAVKIAIDAPKEVSILRKELIKEVTDENKSAVKYDIAMLKSFREKLKND